jgi:hypothetical protein
MTTPGSRPDLDCLTRAEMQARYRSMLDQAEAEFEEAEATRRFWNEHVAPERGESPVLPRPRARQRPLPGIDADGV